MQADPTVRSIALVTIAGDKRVSGAGIVYPAIAAHDFFARLMEEPLTARHNGTRVTNNVAANRWFGLNRRIVSASIISSRSQIFIIALSTERQSGKGPAAELSNLGWRFQSSARG